MMSLDQQVTLRTIPEKVSIESLATFHNGVAFSQLFGIAEQIVYNDDHTRRERQDCAGQCADLVLTPDTVAVSEFKVLKRHAKSQAHCQATAGKFRTGVLFAHGSRLC